MASLVYFKFKANVKTDSVPFDGSAISVKDLKNAIRTKCCFSSADYDLKLEDNVGKEYEKENELIPKYTSIVVRRVPKLNDNQKRKSNLDIITRRDALKSSSNSDFLNSKITNLAESNLPEEEKIRIMMEQSSEMYSVKNFSVKAKPFGIPPPTYICHKCNLSGHWIHNCPGIRDQEGRIMDSKTIKRPTGIPQDHLLEVDSGTPGAYLGKTGRYMVPIKDAEAYALGKKEKRAFTVEENPPYIAPEERKPPKQFICPLCNKLFRNAVLVSCCGTTYCNDCITGHVFDSSVLGSHRCPTCNSPLDVLEYSVFENTIVRNMVNDWIRSVKQNGQQSFNNSPEIILPDTNSTAPGKIVRRVLKPKQPSLVENKKTDNNSIDNQMAIEKNTEMNFGNSFASESNENKKIEHFQIKPELSVSKTLQSKIQHYSPISESTFINSVKNYSIQSSNLPIISNTSITVATMPCATPIEAPGPSMVSVASIGSSHFPFCTGSPLVLPGGENTALVNAMYRNDLAGMVPASIGQSVSRITGVYPDVSLLQPGNIWPSGGIRYVNSMDQGNPLDLSEAFQTSHDLINPLFGVHNRVGEAVLSDSPFPAYTLLSKEEFYRQKRQLLQQSSRRRRRHSRSDDSPVHTNHRRPSNRTRRREEPRDRRHASRYSHSKSNEYSENHNSRNRGYTRVRSRSRTPEDYDTWRRRKNLQKLRDVAQADFNKSHRLQASPLNNNTERRYRSDDYFEKSYKPTIRNLDPMSPRSANQVVTKDCVNETDPAFKFINQNAFINPEKSNCSSQSPLNTSVVPSYAVSDTASSKGPTPELLYRLNSPPSKQIHNDLLEEQDVYHSLSPIDPASARLERHRLKKLKKEKKHKRKQKRKQLQTELVSYNEQVHMYNNIEETVPSIPDDDNEEQKVKIKHKKRKHKKHRDGSASSHKKHKKRKKHHASDADLEDIIY